MIKLIPAVKVLKENSGYLAKKAISFDNADLDPRLVKALGKLPVAENGAVLTVKLTGEAGEGYTLGVAENAITITAGNPQGAFYAVQTLRQLFTQEKVPCVHIEDAPDFAHRGFYHDITRGRISTLDTLLNLVEDMAYYKLNSLQLYVEHVFPFKETADLMAKTDCITPEELTEVLGELEVDRAVVGQINNDAIVRAPGMKYKHYAPTAEVIIVAGDRQSAANYIRKKFAPTDAVLCFEEELPLYRNCAPLAYGQEKDVNTLSAGLFAALRELDDPSVKRVFARCPVGGGVAYAVQNRLKKAAGFHIINAEEV